MDRSVSTVTQKSVVRISDSQNRKTRNVGQRLLDQARGTEEGGVRAKVHLINNFLSEMVGF